MDMGSHDAMTAMTETATAAATAVMSMSTAVMSMSTAATGGSKSGGMSMGHGGMGGGCKISMLWNWYTVDACFIARSWRITSKGMFAGSCIGVILLVMGLEFIRRCQREYDRYIVREAQAARASLAPSADNDSDGAQNASSSKNPANIGIHLSTRKNVLAPLSFRPSVLQQMIRAFFYMVQFGVAYFVMLLAMYYNGYFIICILIGAWLGHFVFGYDNIVLGGTQETGTSCC